MVREPKTAPKVAAPVATGRKAVSPAAAPRVVTPRGTRTVTAARLRGVPGRGAGRAVIRGQNYSAWRSGYRDSSREKVQNLTPAKFHVALINFEVVK